MSQFLRVNNVWYALCNIDKVERISDGRVLVHLAGHGQPIVVMGEAAEAVLAQLGGESRQRKQ